MCKSDQYDCSQTFPECLSKNPVALCDNNDVYYCILKKPNIGGPTCPVCDNAVFDCSVQYSSGKCNPTLTKAVCPDSLSETVYYCVQLKIDQPKTTNSAKQTTTPIQSTTSPPSTILSTTLPLSTTPLTTTTPSTTPPLTTTPPTIPPLSTTLSDKPPATTPTISEVVTTTLSPKPGQPGHQCGNKFSEITPSGPTLCLPGTDKNACPVPVFIHAPLYECVPGSQCCVLKPVTTTPMTTTERTTTPEPTTTTVIPTTTLSPTPGQPGKICGIKYPELTPPGPVLCLPGTDEKACPAPIFTYAPLFECVPGYQCCSLRKQ